MLRNPILWILPHSLDILALKDSYVQESGGVMERLEAALAEVQKKDATAQSALDNCREGLKAEEKKKKELLKNQEDVSWFNLLQGCGVIPFCWISALCVVQYNVRFFYLYLENIEHRISMLDCHQCDHVGLIFLFLNSVFLSDLGIFVSLCICATSCRSCLGRLSHCCFYTNVCTKLFISHIVGVKYWARFEWIKKLLKGKEEAAITLFKFGNDLHLARLTLVIMLWAQSWGTLSETRRIMYNYMCFPSALMPYWGDSEIWCLPYIAHFSNADWFTHLCGWYVHSWSAQLLCPGVHHVAQTTQLILNCMIPADWFALFRNMLKKVRGCLFMLCQQVKTQ